LKMPRHSRESSATTASSSCSMELLIVPIASRSR